MQSNSSDCFYSQLGTTTLGSNNFPFAIHVVSLNIVLLITTFYFPGDGSSMMKIFNRLGN
jgi:hypothetical protein